MICAMPKCNQKVAYRSLRDRDKGNFQVAFYPARKKQRNLR